jgi:pyruvate, water dikinase
VYTRDLAEVRDDHRAVVGGKAASLGELTSTRIATSPGFVVTVDAFRLAMAALDRSGSIPRRVFALPAGDNSALAEIRARIAAVPLPPDLAEAIAAGYARLGVAPVAVRSSSTMEDGAAASFAGLQDSYLGVYGLSAVLDRVRSCWASLYNDESVACRRQLAMPEDGLAMAVVIQRMVSPRAAGVMFTLSPATGDRSVVSIEATWGLGSALVAGEVTPDSFTVSKVTGEITARRTGAKRLLHTCWQNGQGIRTLPASPAMAGRPCLTDSQARALARVAQRVEDHYGAPQDIEWALTASGIVLLQSRPETVWTARGGAPRTVPQPRACDHVLALFGSSRRWS